MANEYDLVVLGGGPAGYVAAIRAAQLKLKVAIVESNKLGGTCLHKGCIPTKALLKSAEHLRNFRHAEEFGIHTAPFTFNLDRALQRKNAVVEQLEVGIKALMKKGKIDVYEGFGRILGPSIFSPLPGTISVAYDDGTENDMLVPKNLLISTGSKPRELPLLPFNGQTIISSDDIVNLNELPATMAIIGGGVIGIEWASMLHDMGVEVTIIEAGSQIVPSEDAEISKSLIKHLTNRGIAIHLNTAIDTVTIHETSVDLTIADNVQKFEKVFVAIGRQANVSGFGIENTDIQITNHFIKVNKNGQTKETHIYAAGDVIGGVQLAHAASNEAVHAVEHMAGLNPTAINTNIPSCIYSYPEVAHIGLTEAQAKEQYSSIKVKKFPFKGNAKALINGEDFGFAKMIVDSDTDDVLGVHLIGDHVTELIAESSLAFNLDASAWEIGQTIHPHPSVSEVMQEVALAIHDEAIHF